MTTKRYSLGLAAALLLLCLPATALAQWGYIGYSQVTVTNAAGGVPLPSAQIGESGHMRPTQVFCFLEGADIRWTIDGTAPTTSVGNLALANSSLPAISGTSLLSNFRAIRTGGTNGTLSCNYFAGGSLPFREWGVGSVASSGGGGGGTVNGSLENNGSPASANRMATLPGIVHSSAPTLTNGRDAGFSFTTAGAARTVLIESDGSTTEWSEDALLGTTQFVENTSAAPGLFYRNDTPDSLVGTTNRATAAGVNANGAVWTSEIDPCSSEHKTTDPFSIVTDTVMIAATSGKKNYICSLVIVAGAAETFSITEGTGSVCGTGEAALAGSTTDANGMPFAANAGFSGIGGNATIIAGKTANVSTCFNVSGSNRVAGFVTWVQR